MYDQKASLFIVLLSVCHSYVDVWAQGVQLGNHRTKWIHPNMQRSFPRMGSLEFASSISESTASPTLSCDGEGYYNHPSDCTKFVRCIKRFGNNDYYPVSFNCAPGTVFYQKFETCVWGTCLLPTDVNECLVNNGGCEQTCNNTDGSFSCSCDRGYLLSSNGKSCDDVNECLVNDGGCKQTCNNTDGSFSCSCEAGYFLGSNGKSCDDVNECLVNDGGCKQTCNNADGSFSCSCEAGYLLGSNGKSCDDVNECLIYNGGCEQTCNNTDGSFSCSCDALYLLGSDGKSCDEICADASVELVNGQYLTFNECPRLSWSEAREACAAVDGGRLASFDDSMAVFDYITENHNGTWYWTGGSDTADEGTWTWADNSTFVLNQWYSGRPNTRPGNNDDCLMVSGGSGYLDIYCMRTYGFICELDTATTT